MLSLDIIGYRYRADDSGIIKQDVERYVGIFFTEGFDGRKHDVAVGIGERQNQGLHGLRGIEFAQTFRCCDPDVAIGA